MLIRGLLLGDQRIEYLLIDRIAGQKQSPHIRRVEESSPVLPDVGQGIDELLHLVEVARHQE